MRSSLRACQEYIKMKRLTYYILITALLLLGFFGPTVASSTFAQSAIGTTVFSSNSNFSNISSTISSTTGTVSGGTPTNSGCTLVAPVSCITYLFNYGLRSVGNIILQLCGLLLWVAGYILNTTILYTVLTMKASINGLPGITLAWTVIRDFINMFFIFVLLYTAVATILDLGGANWRRTVGHLILVAIFINFSLFMTEALIDVSNLAAYGFYNAIAINIAPTNNTSVVNALTNTNANGQAYLQGGISGAIMQKLDLTQIYNIGNASNAASIFGSSVANFMAATLGGSAFILITAFVFFAMAILFVIRFVTLIFLLIFSPVAFIGGLGISRLSQYSSMWWNQLINNLIFAPAMMMMLWICLQMLSGLSTLTGANVGGPFIPVSGAPATTANPLSIMFNFIILIIFMVASIIIAKKAGAGGGDFATKWAGKAAFGTVSKIGQQTIGKLAANRAQNQTLLDREHDKTLAGTRARVQLAVARSISGNSFDLRNANAGATKASGIGGPEKDRAWAILNGLRISKRKLSIKTKRLVRLWAGIKKISWQISILNYKTKLVDAS